MFGFLIALEVLVAVLLIVAVLMQASKGGGLAGTFGGGSVGMMFGVRRTADFLIKSTQILAGAFMVLSLVINLFFLPRNQVEQSESVFKRGSSEQVPTVPQLPPSDVPAGEAGPPQTP
jgi:preprotein translocase subunit SecG